ncbi:MAG: FHA domain-containing protein, partial [Desulfosarcinaceae bacterium]
MKLIWQNPEGETESVEIQQERYDLGRGDDADIQIADENASRIHARLTFDAAGGSLSIEDLDSSNGVFVNGERIEAQRRLKADDVILVGATVFNVQMEPASEADVADATAVSDTDPQRTRVMSLDDIAALIEEGSPVDDEESTQEMDLDATMALDAGEIDPTELYVPASGQAAQPAYKLLVASGEPYGKTFALGDAPLIIGRKPDCDIVLTENAVSGQHAQVRLVGDRVLLSDLGSKNGTLISGNPILEESEMKVGATFTVGATDFKLLNGDTFISAEKRPLGTRKKKQLLATGALALLLLLMAGGKLLMDRRTPTPESQSATSAAQTAAAPPKAAPRTAVSNGARDDGLTPLQPLAKPASQPGAAVNTVGAPVTNLDEGAEERTLTILRETADAFMENRLWQEAIDKLKVIQERAPQTEGITDLLKRAEFERANQERFDKGLSLAARGELETAKTTFAAIPAESVYHDEALLEMQSVDRAAQKATAQLAARKQAPPAKKSASSAAEAKPAVR